MADLDREGLAYCVAGKLHSMGVCGARAAEKRFPHISKKTWNEIGFGRPVSDVNMLAVLAALSLPPSQFVLRSAKHPKNNRKSVSLAVSCEATKPDTHSGRPE